MLNRLTISGISNIALVLAGPVLAQNGTQIDDLKKNFPANETVVVIDAAEAGETAAAGNKSTGLFVAGGLIQAGTVVTSYSKKKGSTSAGDLVGTVADVKDGELMSGVGRSTIVESSHGESLPSKTADGSFAASCSRDGAGLILVRVTSMSPCSQAEVCNHDTGIVISGNITSENVDKNTGVTTNSSGLTVRCADAKMSWWERLKIALRGSVPNPTEPNSEYSNGCNEINNSAGIGARVFLSGC